MAFFSYDILKLKHSKIDNIFYKVYDYFNDRKKTYRTYDIFLLYVLKDKHMVRYLKNELEGMGYRVYMKQKDSRFKKEDRIYLQEIMKQSKSIFFMTSEKYSSSFEMPWEWYYFENLDKKYLAIVPVNTQIFSMYEMVSTWSKVGYCYIAIGKISKQFANDIMIINKKSYTDMLACIHKKEMLFVHKNSVKFVLYDAWIQGEEPLSIDEKLYQMIKYLEDCLLIR